MEACVYIYQIFIFLVEYTVSGLYYYCPDLFFPYSFLLPAFAYGLVCLAMAYTASHMGSVLQVTDPFPLLSLL